MTKNGTKERRMGTFLDHLRDAEGQRRTLHEREKREQAEIRADAAKRQSDRAQASVARSHEQSSVTRPQEP